MGGQRRPDLAQRDAVPAHDHLVFAAAQEPQLARRRPAHQVTGAVRVLAAEQQLSGYADRHRPLVPVDDTDDGGRVRDAADLGGDRGRGPPGREGVVLGVGEHADLGEGGCGVIGESL